MAAIKLYQIFLLYGCIVLALSKNKNDILYDDETDALLQKYLYYLQGAPQKWDDYYDDEEEDEDPSVSAYYEQFVSSDDEDDFEDEIIPEQGGFEVNLRMPDVRPLEDDTYLCHVMPMPKDIPVYIVGYEPHAESDVAHHILLFGCKLPGDFDPVWNCGEMAGSGARPVCMGQQNILYAWALDAPPLDLPKDVGFKVGGDSDIDYLVLQVHYKTAEPFKAHANFQEDTKNVLSMTQYQKVQRRLTDGWSTDTKINTTKKVDQKSALPLEMVWQFNNASECTSDLYGIAPKQMLLVYKFITTNPFYLIFVLDGSTDASGLTMHMTMERQPLVAGVYFMGADGKIPGHSTVNLEGACMYEEKTTLHPFAFRVHAHTLGKVVSAYRIRDNEWDEIGKRDPQLPEMFYPVANQDMTIDKGDILAMRCTMKSDRDRTTNIGSTSANEMCNFYMMYYTEDDLPGDNTCYVFDFKWSDYFKNIPDKEASTLPKDQPGSEMKMDMGPMDVNEPVVEEVIIPPKAGPAADDNDDAQEEEGEKDEEIEVEENQDEDPDPRK